MKRLKKGFTLIELLVVIAIIGILATTLAPKLREQLAKAKDAKAIAVLGAGRTAADIIFVDKMVQTTSGAIEKITLEEIHDKLDSKAQDVYEGTDGNYTNLIIGGSRDSTNKKMTYGGTVALVEPKVSTTSESIELNFGKASNNSNADEYSTEGKKWSEY